MKRLLLIFLLLLPVPAFALDWFVDGELGNDSNIGLAYDSAYFTISKACDTIDTLNRVGDTVWVAFTTYPELIDAIETSTVIIGDTNGIKWSGRAGYPIVDAGDVRTRGFVWTTAGVSITSFHVQSSPGNGFYLISLACDNCSLIDCIGTGSKVQYYAVAGASNFTMTGCRALGPLNYNTDVNQGFALHLAGNDGFAITGCEFNMSTSLGRTLVRIGTATDDNACSFTDSTIAGQSINYATGLIYFSSGNLAFQRNTITGLGSPALVFSETADSSIVDSSIFIDNIGRCIYNIGESLIVRNSQFYRSPVGIYAAAVSNDIFCYNTAFATLSDAVYNLDSDSKIMYCSTWNIATNNLFWGATVSDNITDDPYICPDWLQFRSLSPTWGAGTDGVGFCATLDITGNLFSDYFRYPGMGVYAEAGCWTPTPTRTPTPMPSATPTASPTPSPSSTPTPSPTSTVTPSMTPTPTPAGTTPTKTPTVIPTPSITPTPEHSPTPYVFPTAVPTRTPVGYQSPTPTPIPTPSSLPTPITTPTPIPKPSPTVTPAQFEFNAVLLDYIYSAEIGRWVYILPYWRYNAVIQE